MNVEDIAENAIAIIGMACRFPGANNIEEFWENLCNGVESISFFSKEELEAAGIPHALLSNPDYVSARGTVDNIDMFDAAFFGFTPKEAELMDPQQRLLLECAWNVLESAGYNPEIYQKLIGLFAGSSLSSYYMNNISSNPAVLASTPGMNISIANEPNFLTSRISYKLNLRGPSISINTACSTALVAVHIACQSLLAGECDMALAGGATINVPQQSGYLYEPGGIASPDGHCRAFDASAQGTVGGNGAGLVLLKRLEDALTDNDVIHAIIRGSAINNDGSAKIGFTAPGVEHQTNVIAEALSIAEVEPETIGYVETHGTGTALGDPIEIEALTDAFRHRTDKKGFCPLGSVKTNIGHLDVAAGIAGLIKTILALKHRQIPPSLHYERPNPEIDFENSPFYVNTKLQAWAAQDTPRRAGVSAFGLGGTNAHVILEEAPAAISSAPSRSWYLLTVSAKTDIALDNATNELAAYLKSHPTLNLEDVSYTSLVRRKHFNYRRALVCHSIEDAVEGLPTLSIRRRVNTNKAPRPLVFMFPGQGVQYVNMGRDLYEGEPTFRTHLDQCISILRDRFGLDILPVLYPQHGQLERARHQIDQTEYTQPVVFSIAYALAKTWIDWGILPQAMIGHSNGEFVCACVAGVFSLEDALTLIVTRAKLAQQLPAGAMLSILRSEEYVRTLLDDTLSLAAINLPDLCVVSGSITAIENLQARLTDMGVGCQRLSISHAFHSPLMLPMSEDFLAEIKKIRLLAPKIPYISNVSGTWITDAEAMDATYWLRHLCQPVRFMEGITELLKDQGCILLEVGPGQTLSSVVRMHPEKNSHHTLLSSMRSSQEQNHDVAFLLNTLGQLWLMDVRITWSLLFGKEQRLCVNLPTYPFERQRYWIESPQHISGEIVTEHTPVTKMSIHDEVLVAPKAEAKGKKEEAMPEVPMPVAPISKKMRRIQAALNGIVKDLSGFEPTEEDTYVTFMERGFDSLFLLQVSQAIRERLGVQLALNQLFEELPTLDAIAAYLHEIMPEDAADSEDEIVMDEKTITPSEHDQPAPLLNDPPLSTNHNEVGQNLPVTLSANSSLERIFSRQLDIMAEQLQLLKNTGVIPHEPAVPPTSVHGETIVNGQHKQDRQVNSPIREVSVTPASGKPASEVRQASTQLGNVNPAKFVAFRQMKPELNSGFTSQQQQYLNSFIGEYCTRTQGSKQHNQTYRLYLADPRGSFGFKRRWKEMIYPIVGKHSAGAYLWDVDENKYVDYAMGFGVHLFGHSPSFVSKAIEEQLEQGLQLGPQTYLAGQVAQVLCEMTGMDRAMFCNSGTEAVMAALRIARTVTNRVQVAMFQGSYHGTFDGTLVRGISVNGQMRVDPIAPGVPPHMVENVLLLEYGDPAALQTIREHAHSLAAVLIEPIQSRRPDVQPKEFLQELREITRASGTMMIFDEMITGFRIHPQGAQGWFGIDADLTTYGKVVGGGMPIGVVAGRGDYLGALDGGSWNFGDDSYPQSLQTAFAGTFCKHPLTMAVMLATLNKMRELGPAMQEQLNQRTAQLVKTLNTFLLQEQVPIHVVYCGSLFDFVIDTQFQFSDLFFYNLVHKGIYLWEGRTCFLSTEHSDEDLECLVQAVKDTISELRHGGFLPPLQPTSPDADGILTVALSNSTTPHYTALHTNLRTVPLTDGQKLIWAACQMGEEASCAYNDCDVLKIEGRFHLAAIKKALQCLIDRHDVLRVIFSPVGDYQQFLPDVQLNIEVLDLSSSDQATQEERIATLLHKEAHQPFNFEQGPLLRAKVLKIEEECHLLLLTTHHLIMDTWSYSVLVNELCTIYAAECQHATWQLPQPMQFGDYAESLARKQQGGNLAESEAYWLRQFAQPIPVLDLPTDYPRPPEKTYRGAVEILPLETSLYEALKRLSAQRNCSLYMLMLSAYNVLLYSLTRQKDLVVGMHVAGQASVGGRDLVGYCINVVPIRSHIDDQASFVDLLTPMRKSVLGAYSHSDYAFGRLVQQLKLPRDPSRIPLISTAFNIDNWGGAAAELFGVKVEAQSKAFATSKWDLNIDAVQTESELRFECIYATDLFATRTIQQWLQQFEKLLQEIVLHPELRIETLVHILAQMSRQQKIQEATRLEATSANRLKAVKRKTVKALHQEKGENA